MSSWLQSIQSNIKSALTLGLTGFFITFFYDLLTALSFPLSTGLVEGTLWGSISVGLVFFVMHWVSNTFLFAIFGPGLVRLVNRQLMMHGLGND